MSTESWIDKQGDVWREGDDGLMWTPETAPFPRAHVEKKWGPLRLIPDPTTPTPATSATDTTGAGPANPALQPTRTSRSEETA